MAFKDWGFFPHLAERLAIAGYASVVFNFSLDGADEREPRITRFDLFERNTFSRELADLSCVIRSFSENIQGEGVTDPGKIALLGHSRGGALAILQASEDRRIRAVISWSAIASLDRWTSRQKESWKSDGFLPLARDTTVSPLRLGRGLLDDLEKNRERFDLRAAARRIHVPWLIVHGAADVTVPVRESEQLYLASNPQTTRLEICDHVGHLYNASSPDEDGYRTIDALIDRTVHWLHSSLT